MTLPPSEASSSGSECARLTDGDGAFRVMTAALEDGGVPLQDVDYVNAHGTSTPQGDRIEVRQYMNLSASVDHRLADGANAARFLVTMKRLLENPGLLAL